MILVEEVKILSKSFYIHSADSINGISPIISKNVINYDDDVYDPKKESASKCDFVSFSYIFRKTTQR